MSAAIERDGPVFAVRKSSLTNWNSILLMALLFAVSLALLNACVVGNDRNISPTQPVLLAPETGLVVGSVTAPMVQHYWDISHFRYRKPGGVDSGALESASPTGDFLWFKGLAIQPGGKGPDPGLEGELGRLFAVELEAGTYEIYQLHGSRGPLTNLQPARFVVLPGEILYLGNLHVRYCLYKPDHRVYRSYVAAGIPSVRDKLQRDLALLRRKFPALARSNISPAVIDDSAWQEFQETELLQPEMEC